MRKGIKTNERKKREKTNKKKKREERYRVLYISRECWLLSKEVYTRSMRTIVVEQSHGTDSYFLIESLEVNNFFFCCTRNQYLLNFFCTYIYIYSSLLSFNERFFSYN